MGTRKTLTLVGRDKTRQKIWQLALAFSVEQAIAEGDGMSEITRAEYDIAVKRIEDEEHRQNRRLDKLEETLKALSDLTLTVGKMAVSLETMAKELEKQGRRLEEIEKTPAGRWNTLISAVIGALVAAAITFFLH